DLFTLVGTFCLGKHEITPVPLWHGHRLVYGYRLGSLAYLTDCSAIPDASWELIEGVELLVIDARGRRPHPTHFSVADALAVIERLGPRQAWFTHICHDLPHVATSSALPENVQLAYDGLSVSFRLE